MAHLNGENISKPKTGRYFAFSADDFSYWAAKFSTPSYFYRLPIIMENCDVECPLGLQLGSFHKWGYLAQFSLPEEIPIELSCKAIELALARLLKIDGEREVSVQPQQFIIYRAYMDRGGTLSIARHVINGTSRSYLQFRSAARLSKAQRDPTQQKTLFSAQIS